jgi:antitoxin ParD1/3/4
MHLQISPDLENLINKRLSTGAYDSPEEVLRRALELQDAEESLTEDERLALSTQLEEGYLQAERGELIDGEHARNQISKMKEDWRLAKA